MDAKLFMHYNLVLVKAAQLWNLEKLYAEHTFEYGALQMSTDNIYTSYIKQFQEWCIKFQECNICGLNYIEHLNWSHLNCVDMNYIKHWTICQMAIMCVLKHGMDFFKQVRIVQQMCDINKLLVNSNVMVNIFISLRISSNSVVDVVNLGLNVAYNLADGLSFDMQ